MSQSKHYVKGETYKCFYCDKDFTSISNLRTHNESVHEGKKYNCHDCDKTFATVRGLNLHIQHIHGGNRYNVLIATRILLLIAHSGLEMGLNFLKSNARNL